MQVPSTSAHSPQQQSLQSTTATTPTPNYLLMSPMNQQKENYLHPMQQAIKRRPDILSPKSELIEFKDTKKFKTMHSHHDAFENKYGKCTLMIDGDQVIAYKQEQEAYYYARIVDLAPTCILVHYEGWPPDQASWISYNGVVADCDTVSFGPKGKESKLSWADFKKFYYSVAGVESRKNTGLVTDTQMNLHNCPCESERMIHPERPERLTSIFDSLHAKRLLRYFRRIHAREVTSNELLRVHTFSHVRNYYPLLSNNTAPIKITSIAALLNYSLPSSPILKPTSYGAGGPILKIEPHLQHQQASPSTLFNPPELLSQMDCGQLGISVDTTYHPEHSRTAAKISAGGLIELADTIVRGELKNGFALIRPPGHHAESDTAMGYCFYNNVAVAVSAIMEKYSAKIKKTLIIDWDIHHGNGTQKIFYDNPNVLYISVHRWEHGKFYPFTGAPDECGQAEGLGFNINIALNECKDKPKAMGDTEFIAAFYHLLIPIARQFEPDMIFVSAGFDAAEGHPENLGGYNVTPKGFSLMTKIVCDLASELCNDRLILSLEGGYELESLANSATASMAQLLSNDTSFKHSLNGIKPNLGAIESFRTIVEIQKKYWPCLPTQSNFKFQLPYDWKAKDSIMNRPKRDVKKPSSTLIIEGY
ncbi:hypothetical protein MAM1_0346d09894 [Mucor ambiguus]|uniref:histone deacetylase n=1 Tax=Mucor ambiguus TaxID=91626 RepID=A0A0C9LXR1_9FUNG|nr:hypothetical protein MAM1_0346d09894 [Mucor ambiguus]